MADFLIREADEGDDAEIGDLLVDAFATQFAKKMPEITLSPERIAELRDQSVRRKASFVLVAEVDGRLAGTVALYPWGAPGSEAWIEGAANLRLLAIAAVYRGHGLSTTLLNAAESEASSWGATTVCLHVRRGASGIREIYEARGYTREPAGDLAYPPDVFLEAYKLRLTASGSASLREASGPS